MPSCPVWPQGSDSWSPVPLWSMLAVGASRSCPANQAPSSLDSWAAGTTRLQGPARHHLGSDGPADTVGAGSLVVGPAEADDFSVAVGRGVAVVGDAVGRVLSCRVGAGVTAIDGLGSTGVAGGATAGADATVGPVGSCGGAAVRPELAAVPVDGVIGAGKAEVGNGAFVGPGATSGAGIVGIDCSAGAGAAVPAARRSVDDNASLVAIAGVSVGATAASGAVLSWFLTYFCHAAYQSRAISCWAVSSGNCPAQTS